ncbi:hypothetical protein BHE74_00009280 [Ensete ventricosum]|nr:hypothetical protein BHE74_00009280 [Ensete ventricosum]RZR77192.1 hypothetical protein BHM03_00002203 [Ensete ventricosum]
MWQLGRHCAKLAEATPSVSSRWVTWSGELAPRACVAHAIRPHTARYVPVWQLIGMRTARYQAVPSKSTVGSRLRDKKGIRRRRGEEEKRGYIPHFPAPSSPACRRRPRAVLACGSLTSDSSPV